ncbi:class I SAM-dependent methyltransferase [Flavobacterium psychrophilum]|uniref:class I SAM-dependent methyltransferase n=1 Tax=Flavobacterium psychrophilum TaxID=96345 RepID=UPI00054C50C1|nr:class I SAM-dependent methyltransferase [Flavobacterium psychrophilum]ELY1979868.1 class I SAM-dependent methyltransferase [Flavobacterium psychrophilum]
MNIITRKIYYSLPIPLRYAARKIIYFPSDMLTKKNNLVPPKGIIFTGSGNYLQTGKVFFSYFQKYCDFTPQSSILDIGSGIGRMAIPFTNYLSTTGKYEGFDIVKIGIDWCTKNISSRFPNFNFKLIPLKKDKKCFATFFIIDDQSSKSMHEKGHKNFPFDRGNYALMDKSVKEANVAYKKDYIIHLLESYNFEITNFIRGNWSGIQNTPLNEHQDIIIFKKK